MPNHLIQLHANTIVQVAVMIRLFFGVRHSVWVRVGARVRVRVWQINVVAESLDNYNTRQDYGHGCIKYSIS